MTDRRSVLGTLLAAVAGTLAGFVRRGDGEATAENPATGPEAPVTPDWVRERLKRLEQRIPGAVLFGRATRPHLPRPEDQVYNAFLDTPLRYYNIYVTPDYLGCEMTERKWDLATWRQRGLDDMADGKPTVETWLRIVEDILAVELVQPN